MTRTLTRIAVYCASSDRVLDRYGAMARHVGETLAARGIGIVYGGGSVGLMGAMADAALAAGGEVIGVIPERLWDLEVGHSGCTELHITADMHTRKAKMAELADGFLALPGGWGTWEELLEVTTWTQLGYHCKPVGVLDVDGYYTPLASMLARAVGEGFIRPEHGAILSFDTDLDALLDTMATVTLPTSMKWISNP